MKLELKVLVVAGLFFSAFQCETPSTLAEQESKHCANVDWLTSITEGMNTSTGVSGEVIRYHYKGQTVYYVDTCKGCEDSMAIVYTCSGEVLCEFGGIAGFNTCPDFADKATGKKVIWKN